MHRRLALLVGRSARVRSTPRPASSGRWGGPASRSQERPVSPRKPLTPFLFHHVTCAPRRAQQTRHATTQSYRLRATHHRPIRARRVARLIKLREEGTIILVKRLFCSRHLRAEEGTTDAPCCHATMRPHATHRMPSGARSVPCPSFN